MRDLPAMSKSQEGNGRRHHPHRLAHRDSEPLRTLRGGNVVTADEIAQSIWLARTLASPILRLTGEALWS